MTLPHGKSPRWRRRPLDRPDEILEAALHVFAERGLAGARVEDIAEAAGVSKGTVYLYFKGKEELFKEAVRGQVGRTLEGLAAAAPPGNPVERLDRFVTAYWAHLRRPAFGRLYRLILAELHQFPELSRFYADEVSGRILLLSREIIADGVERGVFRDVEPQVASRMLVGLLIQHAVWTSQRELFPHLGQRSDDALLGEIKDFVFTALGQPGGHAGDTE
ncbi:MAG TPA: TetR/AcrR family transcriptional regulator [Longimicrobiales bacterium]|nr:TetR/AcrR family transcriptional regulator [Longimicrobiales bacterium]